MNGDRPDHSLFDMAVKTAVDAHSGIKRKGKEIPYILHPMEAAAIAATISDDEEILSAAILHDVIEDTDITAVDLEKLFGNRVASLVVSVSDIEIQGQNACESWRARKEAAIERIRTGSYETKVIAMGDKLSNMRAIYRDYMKQGDELWTLFHVKDRADHKWHYKGLMDALSELAETEAYREFSKLFTAVFGE